MKESIGKKLLRALLSPIAFGFYLTLIFSGVSFVYYAQRDNVEQMRQHNRTEADLWTFLNDLDQKSVDYRLRIRGPRAGSPDVAVLAVDDRSVDSVGRWPWPRETISRALENAVKLGASVIAADIVFSEPSDRPEIRLVTRVQERAAFTSEQQDLISEEVARLDADARLAEVVQEHGSKIVLGNFHNGELLYSQDMEGVGYLSYCYNLIFESSRAHKVWNGDDVLVAATDANEMHVPEVLTSLYGDHLRYMEDGIRQESPTPATAIEAKDLENKIFSQKFHFCNEQFLRPESDPIYPIIAENWKQVRDHESVLQASTFDEWVAQFKQSSLANLVPESLSWTMNIPVVSSYGKNNGFFNAALDPDGTVRKSQLIMRSGNHYMASIALKAYLLAKNANPDILIEPTAKVLGAKGIRSLKIRDNDSGDHIAEVPVGTDGKLLINYAGKRYMFPHVSIADLLAESQEDLRITQNEYDSGTGQWETQFTTVKKAEFFKNKFLIFGATAVGIYDLRVTPFDENFPGVETHANVLDNLLRGDFLKRHASEDFIMPVVMLALGLLLSIILSYVGALYGLLTTLILLSGIFLVDNKVLFANGLVASTVFPALQVLFSYVGLTFYKYFTEERSKRELRATFSKYVSPAIVEEILQDPKNLELGGRKERITVFFSDVRGFTTISEKLDPKALSELLNSYLTPMTEVVFKHQGTLDKYIGDAIMAFFGAPIPYPDHAAKACRCALEQLERLKELQKQYARKNLPEINIGIGLNTGECSVGNMGSVSLRNYTVLGDAVNLASRLESINKQYGTRVIISEFTHAEIKDSFICREVDWVRVKGKLEPVKIYELLGEEKLPQKNGEVIKLFNDGYESYHRKNFDKAVLSFEKAAQIDPEDEPSKIYIQRCRNFMTAPPPENWDGVYVMKVK